MTYARTHVASRRGQGGSDVFALTLSPDGAFESVFVAGSTSDDYGTAVAATEDGEVIVAGEPESSYLLELIEPAGDSAEMPKGAPPLSGDQVATRPITYTTPTLGCDSLLDVHPM